MCLTLVLSNKAQLQIGFQVVKIKEISEGETSGIIQDFNLVFKEKQNDQDPEPLVEYILENVSPKVNLLPSRNGLEVVIDLDRLICHLNDHHIFCLMLFAKKQGELFLENTEAKRIISEQTCYRKGKLKLLTVFKTWK